MYMKFTILERCLHYLMITPRITRKEERLNWFELQKKDVCRLKC